MKGRWPPTFPSSSPLPLAAREGEPELVARAVRGDHEAFATLVRPYERVAYRVAAAITGWNADAEEATQNGFVKAYRSLHRFRAGAAFRPWLLRIVVNEAHNVLRSERRHERLGARAAEQHEAAIAGADETVIAREEVETVLGALARLPDADRLALALRYFAELPDGEAAAPAWARRRRRTASASCAPAGGSKPCWRKPMAEHELELRLRAVARALDADAPAFDPALPPRRPSAALPSERSSRWRPSSPLPASSARRPPSRRCAASSTSTRSLSSVRRARRRAPVRGTARCPPDAVQSVAPFRVRTISSLGAPDAAYVRDDIAGGMVTVVYGDGRCSRSGGRPTWTRASRSSRRRYREDVTVGRLPALWIEGTARGTFTLIGADGAVHRERFDVSPGVLLWKDDGDAFLLQGAGSKDDAVRLAGAVD